MSKAEIYTISDKIYKRDVTIRIIRIALLSLLAFLILVYFVLSIIYNEGRFTVSLDKNFFLEKSIVIYEEAEQKIFKKELVAEKLDLMDNISVDWLPGDLNSGFEGSHNGENYIAYTFYVENQGENAVNYWSNIIIDDVIKDVDSAIRFRVYQNDEQTTYAKLNGRTGQPEKDTTPFYSDTMIMQKERKDFKPGDIDKYTIVIWIEGDDPDCTDALLGGELKTHMEITEEHIEDLKGGENE